jgi:hypothetical protein
MIIRRMPLSWRDYHQVIFDDSGNALYGAKYYGGMRIKLIWKNGFPEIIEVAVDKDGKEYGT